MAVVIFIGTNSDRSDVRCSQSAFIRSEHCNVGVGVTKFRMRRMRRQSCRTLSVVCGRPVEIEMPQVGNAEFVMGC